MNSGQNDSTKMFLLGHLFWPHVYHYLEKSYLIPKATQDTRMNKKSEACMNFIFSRVIRSDKYMLYNVHSLDSSQCLVLDCWSEYSGDVL